MTARTLETLIRLSTAHAKARLSSKVEQVDAMIAEGILRFALFKEVQKKSSHKRRKLNTGKPAGDSEGSEEEDEEEEDEEESSDEEPEEQPRTRSNAKPTATRGPSARRGKTPATVTSPTSAPRYSGAAETQDTEMMDLDESQGAAAGAAQVAPERYLGVFLHSSTVLKYLVLQATIIQTKRG